MLIEVNSWAASSRPMPLTTTPDRAERALIGQAFRNLREAKGLGMQAIASALGMTTQGWQYYEVGERKFTREKIAGALDALQLTEEDLLNERARILGSSSGHVPSGMYETRTPFVLDVYGKPRVGPSGLQIEDAGAPSRQLDLRQLLGSAVDAMEMADDRMIPWAWPGEMVIFDRERSPRRGSGCVIEMRTGEAFVRIYEGSDGSTLFAKELHPEERVTNYDLSKVRGVYLVKLRGD